MPSKKKLEEERLRFDDADDVQAMLTTWGAKPAAAAANDAITFRDKLRRYMKGRKTPTTTDQIAEYFLVSKSTASVALKELHEEGLVELLKLQTRRKLWIGK